MKALALIVALGLAGCPPVGPVVPVPDASDAAPGPMPPLSGDAGVYAACCDAMHDTALECPIALQHVVETRLTVLPAACKACGLACK